MVVATHNAVTTDDVAAADGVVVAVRATAVVVVWV